MKHGFANTLRSIVFTVTLVSGATTGLGATPSPSIFAPLRDVLTYAFATTVSSSVELNSWWSLDNRASLELTKRVHARLGSAAFVDIYQRAGDGDRSQLFVLFPEFQVEGFKFVLGLSRDGSRTAFLGYGVQLDGDLQLVQQKVEFALPKDCDSIVRAHTQLSNDETALLRRWVRDALADAYGGTMVRTNHVFVRPFSPRWDTKFSVYWLEGQKVIQMDLPRSSKEPMPLRWKELLDFDRPSAPLAMTDAAIIDLRRKHELGVHVRGTLITYELGK